jgi:hypothetical protein
MSLRRRVIRVGRVIWFIVDSYGGVWCWKQPSLRVVLDGVKGALVMGFKFNMELRMRFIRVDGSKWLIVLVGV